MPAGILILFRKIGAVGLIIATATGTVCSQTKFTEVAAQEGVQVAHHHDMQDPSYGTGAVWFDCDGDGDLDLFVSNRGANHLFRNNRIGNGTPDFTDITTPVIADAGRDGCGAAAADYDNDGDMDLFLTNYSDDLLLENDGSGNFTDVTSRAFPGLSPLMPQFGSSAAWGDLNNDGWLDLYVSNYDHVDSTIAPSDFLFISNGGSPVTFENRSSLLAGDVDQDGTDDLNGFGFIGIITDVNNDGWADIFATNDCPLGPEGNKLWINNGDLTFTESIAEIGPFTRGITTPECSDVMGIPRGDPNHDGWLDYHMTNVHVYGENSVLLQNNGQNLLNVSGPAGLDKINFKPENGLLFTWGTNFLDYDLDTWQDLAVAGGSLRDVYQPNFLFHNENTETGGIPGFRQVSRDESGIANGASTRTMVMADYDMDGDPDLFTVNFNDVSSLYRNENNNGNHWFALELQGAGAPLSNRNGIGAKVRLITPDNVAQFHEVHSGSSLGGGDDIAAYFGLAGHETFDLEITWPSGIRQVMKAQQANQRLRVKEPAVLVTLDAENSVLKKDSPYTIRWKASFSEDVRIILKDSNSQEWLIAESEVNDGQFTWTPAIDLPNGHYQLQVISTTSADDSGCSELFSITGAADAHVWIETPDGGALLENNKQVDITWGAANATGNVSLVLFNGETELGQVAESVSNDGLYSWVVPDTLNGNNFFLEIRTEAGYTDRMERPFSIIKNYIDYQVPDIPAIGGTQSHARIWNEMLLECIRNDYARPTVHARNLFHISAAMYDAWAAFDEEARPYFLGNTRGNLFIPFEGIPSSINPKRSQEEAISYAAYRLMKYRFRNSPGAPDILDQIDILFNYLGYDATNTSVDYTDGSPAALGNYIAEKIIAYGLQDGSNEGGNYENRYYKPVNPPMYPLGSGAGDIMDPNRWQPLTFETFIDQSGNVIPGGSPSFLSPEWGDLVPFSLNESDLTIHERDGHEYRVYHDPGPPAYLDPSTGGGNSEYYKWGFELVSVWSSHLDPYDGVMWDISPASQGNIETLPGTLDEYDQFYRLTEGGDPGQGYEINPVTGAPYETQLVPRGDYTRVLAEFWADGPDSETPPGHWFTILNYINDHPDLEKRFQGEGRIVQDLEWDIKSYFILGGAMHDVAISSWGIKGYYDYIRPVSAIRYMCSMGQSSDPEQPNYHPAGIELIPGYIEMISPGDPLAGADNEHVGKIKVKAWRGHNEITDPGVDEAGIGWILGDDWIPYQRPSFVTPPFAGYVSGHSTYSRAAAEILTRLTGDEYFPGGMSEFVAPKDDFLVFEKGPSTDVVLQWAKYTDAADQCSLSRIWGGIHPPIDDIPGRKIGKDIGIEAFEYARSFFTEEVVTSVPDYFSDELVMYPNPLDQDQLNFRIPGKDKLIHVSIFDVRGVALFEEEVRPVNGMATLDLSRLGQGMYIMKLTGKTSEFTQKLIRK